MLVVDTNILVPLFIHGQRQQDVFALLEGDSAWCTEPFALIELVNVFATYVRSKLLAVEAARRHLEEAKSLLTPNFHRVPLQAVLDQAVRYKVNADDAHFLAVAEAKHRKLITEDLKLRAAAPKLTQSLDEALANMR
jgi:predicted nucleic acid-binding protein